MTVTKGFMILVAVPVALKAFYMLCDYVDKLIDIMLEGESDV
jgi:hypothetical protein